MDPEKVLDMLLTGYSHWVRATDYARTTMEIKMAAMKAIAWWERAAAEANVPLPPDMRSDVLNIDNVIISSDSMLDEHIAMVERKIQRWFMEVLKKVFSD